MSHKDVYINGLLGGSIMTLILLILILAIINNKYENNETYINNSDTITNVTIKLVTPEFLMSTNPEEDLFEVLNYYNVQYPEVVYAQAVLETGHFRSKVFREYNNLFGLYNSNTEDYYKFDHWSDSVKAYKDYVQRKYNSGDYFQFLIDLPYATDPEYINKLKQIIK